VADVDEGIGAAEKAPASSLARYRATLLWYRCYYPHRSRDALSPVDGIFTGSNEDCSIYLARGESVTNQSCIMCES
jgi:hypothetical protein